MTGWITEMEGGTCNCCVLRKAGTDTTKCDDRDGKAVMNNIRWRCKRRSRKERTWWNWWRFRSYGHERKMTTATQTTEGLNNVLSLPPSFSSLSMELFFFFAVGELCTCHPLLCCRCSYSVCQSGFVIGELCCVCVRVCVGVSVIKRVSRRMRAWCVWLSSERPVSVCTCVCGTPRVGECCDAVCVCVTAVCVCDGGCVCVGTSRGEAGGSWPRTLMSAINFEGLHGGWGHWGCLALMGTQHVTVRCHIHSLWAEDKEMCSREMYMRLVMWAMLSDDCTFTLRWGDMIITMWAMLSDDCTFTLRWSDMIITKIESWFCLIWRDGFFFFERSPLGTALFFYLIEFRTPKNRRKGTTVPSRLGRSGVNHKNSHSHLQNKIKYTLNFILLVAGALYQGPLH